jgi:uncharacterized delta-60 repeat protein
MKRFGFGKRLLYITTVVGLFTLCCFLHAREEEENRASGISTVSISGTSSKIEKLVFQSDHKTLAQGPRTESGVMYSTLVRYLSNGVLDTTFNGTGIIYTSLLVNVTQALGSYREADVAVDTSGRAIAVGGEVLTGSNYKWAIMRYLSNGVVDTSFNTTGKLNIVFLTDGTQESAKDVAVQTDGRLVVIGKTKTSGGDIAWGVVRLHTDGTFDTSFSTVGYNRRAPTGSPVDTARAIVLQTNGQFVVGGEYGHGVGRYNTDGSMDTSFSRDGFNYAGNSVSFSLAVQSDHKPLVGGSGYIYRYRTDGELDTTFGTNGVFYGYGVGNKEILAEPTGTILATGESGGNAAVLRLLSNGSIDTTFGSSGIQTYPSPLTNAYGLARTMHGRIMVGGTEFTLARSTICGPLDYSFGNSRWKLSEEEALLEEIKRCPQDRAYLEKLYSEALTKDKAKKQMGEELENE